MRNTIGEGHLGTPSKSMMVATRGFALQCSPNCTYVLYTLPYVGNLILCVSNVCFSKILLYFNKVGEKNLPFFKNL